MRNGSTRIAGTGPAFPKPTKAKKAERITHRGAEPDMNGTTHVYRPPDSTHNLRRAKKSRCDRSRRIGVA